MKLVILQHPNDAKIKIQKHKKQNENSIWIKTFQSKNNGLLEPSIFIFILFEKHSKSRKSVLGFIRYIWIFRTQHKKCYIYIL